MVFSVEARRAAEYFARLSRELMEEPEERPTMQRIAERAVVVVPGCDHCGISVRRRHKRVETVAFTSPIALRCDELQYSLGEGPCLEAIWQDGRHVATDTRNDGRWPTWSPRVAEEGIGSVLSIRLATPSETLGALNLYADSTHAFRDDDIDLAVIYATHAANAMRASLLFTGLQTAVESRHTIGVAQGILMQTYGITVEQSFELLRRLSSQTNTKLRTLAERVVASGGLPDHHPRPD